MRSADVAGRARREDRPTLKTINDIAVGTRAITPETARQLERVLGVPAAFWSRLESNYQEHAATRGGTC